jgi:predicted AAA+ superfamily ATPase
MGHIKRFFKMPKQSFFLFGPRGTGKSTYLKKHFKNPILIDLLKPDVFRYYKAFPERLREILIANPEKKVVIIDEIQKVPELLDVVHSCIEEKKQIQFILTGSSSRKLKRKGVNLLAGRAILKHFHPFMASELKEKFSLNLALERGLLPLVWGSEAPKKVLKTYASLYLKEEVQEEGLVRNIGNFARFLEIISFSHASILNTTNIARECLIKRTTVENYIQILKDLLLGFTIDIFTKRAKRALSSHPKFYLFDAGVYNNFRPLGVLDDPLMIKGAALEGLIAQHLRAWIDFQEEEYKLYFWRTRSGLEIDFIIYGKDYFLAIEVKNNSHISSKDIKGLKAFKKDYPECRPILLFRGKEKIIHQGIECIPIEEFLPNLSPDSFY